MTAVGPSCSTPTTPPSAASSWPSVVERSRRPVMGSLRPSTGPRAAFAARAAIRDAATDLHVDVRVGLHTGEIELRGDDIGGLAVHIGQRVSAAAHAVRDRRVEHRQRSRRRVRYRIRGPGGARAERRPRKLAALRRHQLKRRGVVGGGRRDVGRRRLDAGALDQDRGARRIARPARTRRDRSGGGVPHRAKPARAASALGGPRCSGST